MSASFHPDDPERYVGGTPYQELATLRRTRPFAWHHMATNPGDGFWLAARHADVVAISRNPKLFATHAPLLADPLPRAAWPTFPALAMIADNLMTYDHQKHPAFRPAANLMFSAARRSATGRSSPISSTTSAAPANPPSDCSSPTGSR